MFHTRFLPLSQLLLIQKNSPRQISHSGFEGMERSHFSRCQQRCRLTSKRRLAVGGTQPSGGGTAGSPSWGRPRGAHQTQIESPCNSSDCQDCSDVLSYVTRVWKAADHKRLDCFLDLLAERSWRLKLTEQEPLAKERCSGFSPVQTGGYALPPGGKLCTRCDVVT